MKVCDPEKKNAGLRRDIEGIFSLLFLVYKAIA
jgi:hypothetical protein